MIYMKMCWFYLCIKYTWLCTYLHISQLRICRPPPLSFKWKIWIEWTINLFIYPIFIFWVMADCIYNLRATHRDFEACHQPKWIKKSLKSGQIYRKDAQWAETNEKSTLRFLFLYREKFIENRGQKKKDHNSKNKNRKDLKLDLTIDSADSEPLSCEFEHFWIFFFFVKICQFFFCWGALSPTKKNAVSGNFF